MSKASTGELVQAKANSVPARVGHKSKATHSKADAAPLTQPVSLPLPEKAPQPASLSLKEQAANMKALEVKNWGELLTDGHKQLTGRRYPRSSAIRKTAIKIAGMRNAGMKAKEIGEILKLSPNSVRHYTYIAGREGWFKPSNYKDDIEYNLSHKIMRNLDAALDSYNPDIARETAMELGKQTIFKSFDGVAAQAPPSMNVLSIRIENSPTGSPDPIRIGAIGGSPRFLDGETTPTQENER